MRHRAGRRPLYFGIGFFYLYCGWWLSRDGDSRVRRRVDGNGENGRQAPAGAHPEILTSHSSVVLRVLLPLPAAAGGFT
jgi:hypothetical protein